MSWDTPVVRTDHVLVASIKGNHVGDLRAQPFTLFVTFQQRRHGRPGAHGQAMVMRLLAKRADLSPLVLRIPQYVLIFTMPKFGRRGKEKKLETLNEWWCKSVNS